MRRYDKAHAALAPGLTSRGMDAEAIDRVATGMVRRAAEQQQLGFGPATGFALSKDGNRVVARQGEFLMTEMSVPAALAQPRNDHLEAASMAARGALDPTQTLAVVEFHRVVSPTAQSPLDPVRSYG